MKLTLAAIAFMLLLAAAFWSPEVYAVGRDALFYTLDTHYIMHFDAANLRSGCFF